MASLRAIDLIGVLVAHRVHYVVIGGFAAIAHGSPRATRDLDIVAAPDNDNLGYSQDKPETGNRAGG